jgi:hypothetical protein
MGHYAKVKDGKVVNVIVAEQEFIDSFVDDTPGKWIQTSYNTHANEHTQDGTPLRGNYAGIGFIYDETNDVFYEPQPFNSWTLNTSTWLWEAPVDYPTDGQRYRWNEAAYQAALSDSSDTSIAWEIVS